MNPAILTAFIATGGVIVGAIVTALASAYAAGQKIKEIEVSYLQKMREDYLANARLYTNGVYVPLSIALSKLLKEYYEFRTYIDFPHETVDEQHERKFRQACEEYEKEVSALNERGADAFLTTELEESLRSFSNFIKASLGAQEPKLRVISSYFVPFLQFNYSVATEIQGKWVKVVRRIPKVHFRSLYIGFSYLKEELLAAPLPSREFEQRILDDERALKFLIKEVTLGAHTARSKSD